MLCYVMLCYVMLCYVMLCYVMLCYVMLRYATLHYRPSNSTTRTIYNYVLSTACSFQRHVNYSLGKIS